MTNLRSAHEQVRSIARGLSSLDLEAAELPEMLGGLARRARADGIDARFECSGDLDLRDDTTATHLFHIAQQALSNALEHARAAHIELRLHQSDETLTLEVLDDGRGMAGHPRNAEGAGLRIMRHRAALCGAWLDLSSEEGGGTRVRCRLRLLRGRTPGHLHSQA